MKVKLLNKIDKKGLDILNKKGYEYGEDIDKPEAILLRSANILEEQFNPELVCISRAGAGVNNIPLDRCASEGIIVFNTPGANANAVSELTIASIIIASRNIIKANKWIENLDDTTDLSKIVEKNKSQFVGSEIKGKTLGVVGLGAIGGMVANNAYHLGMEVLGYDPHISINAAWHLSRAIEKAESLDEIYSQADYITVHVPSIKETKNFINKDSIAKMKDGVKIINLARGDLVNTDDIIEAVKSGKVSTYITDFADEKMLGVDNIIAIPHLGASTNESEENCAIMAAKEVCDFFEYGVINNSVNYPSISQAKTCEHRIIVLHKNIPGMLAKISNSYLDEDFNIESLFSQANEKYAVSVLDTHMEVPNTIIENINKIDGVIRVIIN